MKEGGAAKGELVLAMYELANSFRHGWGVEKDPVAARSYYETAANLGDTDAMNEVARCYEEGFGGKKDKVSASPLFFFLRLFYFTPLPSFISSTGGRRSFTTPVLFFPRDWRQVFLGSKARSKEPKEGFQNTRREPHAIPFFFSIPRILFF